MKQNMKKESESLTNQFEKRKENRNSDGVLLLSYGSSTNFIKWSQEMSDHLFTNYGNHSSFTITNEAYVYPQIPRPTVVSLNAANDPFGDKKLEFLERRKTLLRNEDKLLHDRPALWSELMKSLSAMSKEKVISHPDYTTAELDNRNPVLLWKTIRKVHYANENGDIIGARQSLRMKLNAIKHHPNESLLYFKMRVDEIYVGLKSLGAEVLDEEQVQFFLNKMDLKRFGNYLYALRSNINLMNGGDHAAQYPKTLSDCVTKISTWEECQRINNDHHFNNNIKSFNNSETIFYTNNTRNENNQKDDLETVLITTDRVSKRKNDDKRNLDKFNNKYPDIECFNCGLYGHYKSDCKNARKVKVQKKQTNNEYS